MGSPLVIGSYLSVDHGNSTAEWWGGGVQGRKWGERLECEEIKFGGLSLARLLVSVCLTAVEVVVQGRRLVALQG
jgi:hypothetical protein